MRSNQHRQRATRIGIALRCHRKLRGKDRGAGEPSVGGRAVDTYIPEGNGGGWEICVSGCRHGGVTWIEVLSAAVDRNCPMWPLNLRGRSAPGDRDGYIYAYELE
jgi:hypothetical protein